MICKNLELEISLDDPTYITSKDSMESVIFLTNRIIVTCQSLSHNIVQINGIQVGLELCFSSKKKKKNGCRARFKSIYIIVVENVMHCDVGRI